MIKAFRRYCCRAQKYNRIVQGCAQGDDNSKWFPDVDRGDVACEILSVSVNTLSTLTKDSFQKYDDETLRFNP